MVSLWRMRSRRISRIDTAGFSTAFIVIALTVLVIFMICPIRVDPGLGPDLPNVSATTPMRGSLREDAILVGVLRDGAIFFGSHKTRSDALPDKIRAALKSGAERKVYIKAAARARYGVVSDVLDAVHEAGIQNITFIVEERRTSAQ
jgi:biopolymer transport protein ExbD